MLYSIAMRARALLSALIYYINLGCGSYSQFIFFLVIT